MSGPTALPGSLASIITTESGLVEKPGIDLLVSTGWVHSDLLYEQPEPLPDGGLQEAANWTGRRSFRDLLLPVRFRTALRKLNPLLPEEALQLAENAVTADRSAMLPIAANRDVYRLLHDGV